MSNNQTLQNQIALVTGASRGIGAAIAQELGKQGATVIGTATSAGGADNINASLQAAGIKGMGLALDVNDASQIDAASAMARKNQRCQPPAPARKLKAAPGFSAWTRLKNGVTSCDQPSGVVVAMELLAAWSAASTTNAREYQWALRLG